MVHLLASGIIGTVHVVVPIRTFVSTITGNVFARKFDIHTGAAILPAGSTPGVAASQPDHCPDEAGSKKRVGGCRGYFHFTAESSARVSPQTTVWTQG